MGRSQTGVEKCDQRFDLAPNLGILAQLIHRRERQQDECVVIGIAREIDDRAVRIEQMDEARPAIGAFGLRQEIVETLASRFRGLADTSRVERPWRSSRSAGPERGHGGAPRGPPCPRCRAVRQNRPWPDPNPRRDHNGSEFSIIRVRRTLTMSWASDPICCFVTLLPVIKPFHGPRAQMRYTNLQAKAPMVSVCTLRAADRISPAIASAAPAFAKTSGVLADY